MDVKLDGEVALVTGSGRGIGRAIAMALAEHGAHVVVTARTASEIEAVAKGICDAGGQATAITADISDEASVEALFAQIQQRLRHLDIAVNNAGVGRFGMVKDMSAEDFDRVMAVNLRGTFLCCRAAMRLMASQRSGYIINISSVVGFRGYPDQGAYTASKHGVMGLTKSLAVEAQPYDIRVSAVSPGGTDTEMIWRARPDLDTSTLMDPRDIAQTVLFLLSLSERAHVDEIYIRRRTSKPF